MYLDNDDDTMRLQIIPRHSGGGLERLSAFNPYLSQRLRYHRNFRPY